MSKALSPILIDRNHPSRAEAESLISGVYEREYGAKIVAFSDLLIALPGDDGVLKAAAGLRIGGNFFSEIYLDRPIERVLSDHWLPPATRAEIAEVTTLAALHPNASHALFSGIIGYLNALNVRFAFFTVTERLHRMLIRAGIPAEELATAKAEHVHNAEEWGRYYATNPKVVAIHDAFVSMPATHVDTCVAPLIRVKSSRLA
ncbi:MAG: thermostable hemolysin [Magnetovibrio sp.]|nr:thermostable hemolysin [Magnetovibrio sp.]